MAEEKSDKRGTPPGAGTVLGAGDGGGGRIGNPPHEVTDEKRRQVRELAGLQITQKEIAAVLGVSEDTLQRHYSADFEEGRLSIMHALRRTSFQMALGQLKDPAKPELGYADGMTPHPTMLIWLSKTQLGWRETTKHEIVGGQINVHITPDDLEL